MEQVLQEKLTIRLAAECLNLSERQVKRLKKGMREKGVAALMHGNRGRTPKHAISKDIKDMVASLAQGLYKDASAQHMSELLAERQSVNMSSKSVRRILKERGIPNPHSCKQHRRRRKSRDRAPKLGMLVQMDASPFAWIEDRGPKLDLHGAIDDATGKVLGLHFRPNEDLRGYLEVLRYMAIHFGIPGALYTDGHTIFFSPKKDKLTIEEELAGKQVALTQLGRVIDELGIIHIHARSPQAKGRIERLWETLQSRLKVEMRIAGISTIEEANAFLPGFIEKFNARFAVEPADPEPAFLPAVAKQDLEAIMQYGSRQCIIEDAPGVPGEFHAATVLS
jgi:transposase